jgi:hypothetical protein
MATSAVGAASTRGGGDVPPLSDESGALQRKLRASDEEWNVIFPKLQRIARLREEVNAVAPSTNDATRKGRGGLNSPLGGTSLDTPTAPAGMNGPRRGFPGGGSIPFDPKTAPGHVTPSNPLLALLGIDTPQVRRNMGRGFRTNQGNSVEALLAELQTLVAAKDTPKAQIQAKLESIRAARARAARDLQRAQNDLAPLLTSEQVAILVSLGHLD